MGQAVGEMERWGLKGSAWPRWHGQRKKGRGGPKLQDGTCEGEGVRSYKMVHARERRERRVLCGKAVRERERGGPGGSEGSRW